VGPFLYGYEKERRVIKAPYRIGAYPVTNTQFAPFVEVNGYERRDCWSDDGWAWRTGTYDSTAPDWLRDWLKNRPPERRDRPFWWQDEWWGSPLCPVVGLSWFEAEAYCRWLALEAGIDPDDPAAPRLPAEEEWERAVRGAAGSEYPWGAEWDRTRLNCAEWWAGRELPESDALRQWWDSEEYKETNPTPTAVVTFPEGVNPAGLWDGGGNVWEWTGSWYTAGETRVLRGGSWYFNRRYVRCASRDYFIPDCYSYNVGFRVVFPGAS
jgi:formylglycine-generating enzyme required for sulfatase activity